MMNADTTAAVHEPKRLPRCQEDRVTSPGRGMKPFVFGLDLREVAGLSIEDQQAEMDRFV